MRNQKRHIIVLLLSSLALFAVGCSEEAATGSNQTVPTVKVMTVGQPLMSGEMYSGKILPTQEIQVISKLSGKVANVSVEEGAVVHKGQQLIQLETEDYRQQVQQAQAGISAAQARLSELKAGTRSQQIVQQESVVAQAKASLATAEKTYNRYKALFDSGAISQADLEKVALDLDKARATADQVSAQLDLLQAGSTAHTIAAQAAEVSRAQSSLSLAQISLANTSIVSPIDGIVAKRSIDPGEMAQPGVALLTVVDMNQVKVEVSVNQTTINQIKLGADVTVNVAGLPNQSFQGKVAFISPVSDTNSSTFPVKVLVGNQQGLLRAGMIAQVSFTGEQLSGMEVPASAVFTKEKGTYLYVVDGDTLRQTAVTVKPKNKDWVYVSSGLTNNDRIVITPVQGLADGSKVQVEKGV